MIIDWVKLRTRSNPLTVQVLTYERAAVVANDYAVRIEHWYYFEDVSIPQELRLRIVTNKEINTAFHHVRSI